MNRVAVVQSNYIPWKGYFDLIRAVDTFVFYDDVQYTTNDWRNRNRIKTAAGLQWLTIPVGKHMHRRICDVTLPSDGAWADTHWRRIEAAYRQAPHFPRYRDYFETLYRERRWTSLSELNQAFVIGISRDLLGVTTQFAHSHDYPLTGTKSARLLDLLAQVGADVYVSGPSARAYLSDEELIANGLRVEWQDYAGYPEYPQPHGDYCHAVSILDLLFQTGPEAAWHIWGWRDAAAGTAAA